MRWKLLLAPLLLTLLSVEAHAQLPPIDSVAGPTTSFRLKSIMTDATGSGPLVFATKSLINASVFNQVVMADQQPGADAGAKISAALALCPTPGFGSGCIVDARGLTGFQTLSTPINCSYAQIIFGAAVFTQSATITVGQTCSIQGTPTGIGLGNNFGLTFFVQAWGASLSSMFLVSGGQATVQNIVVDGSKAHQTSSGPNILVTGSHVYVANVISQNSFSDGFKLSSSSPTINDAAVGTFFNIVSASNGGDGFNCIATSDTMIDLSSFEFNAGAAGIELNNCPATRVSNFDVGGNVIGIWAHGAAYNPGVSLGAYLNIINHGQLGDQSAQDILIDGTNNGSYGNLITGVEFLGGNRRTSNAFAALEISNGTIGGNILSGSLFNSISGNTYSYAVYIHGAGNVDTMQFQSIGTYGTSIVSTPSATRLDYCDATASACSNSMVGTQTTTGTFTAVGSSSLKTLGANAGDRFALQIVNPTTAAFGAVQATWADGNGSLAAAVAIRNNAASSGTLYLQTANSGGTLTNAVEVDQNQKLNMLAGAINLKGFAVGSLPRGKVGDIAYVTDQRTTCPANGGTFTGGGSVKCLAFYNGTAWVKP